MMNQKPKDDLGKEYVFQKLGKSIVAYEDMEKDTELNLNNLSGIIFSEQYIPVRDSYKVLGKKIKGSLKKGEPILEENLY